MIVSHKNKRCFSLRHRHWSRHFENNTLIYLNNKRVWNRMEPASLQDYHRVYGLDIAWLKSLLELVLNFVRKKATVNPRINTYKYYIMKYFDIDRCLCSKCNFETLMISPYHVTAHKTTTWFTSTPLLLVFIDVETRSIQTTWGWDEHSFTSHGWFFWLLTESTIRIFMIYGQMHHFLWAVHQKLQESTHLHL